MTPEQDASPDEQNEPTSRTPAPSDSDPSAVPTAPHTLLHTPAEAATLLATSESWLRRKAGQRLLPCTIVGKRLRFAPSDLEKIIAISQRPARDAGRGTGPAIRRASRRRRQH
ncbi:helix-turn-helix domain-containing protein [Amycolatopsis sp. H20-H5]|uniref:helix-turn-helix domain-containing protein n=1 Tax=Amycolatopsis sp. H20-H5 TaxID=3046309 RepID=UPI002DBF8F73|nr:helix-turn-helix domain-containing protein [Amycolatopsis sp. H20-H5]MEC3979891.1 helix-turn-helix domain-containing protein [Amycolatopsis sp. H20-H5]